jgi:Zn-dependent M28 family amino/carboxypeptidase
MRVVLLLAALISLPAAADYLYVLNVDYRDVCGDSWIASAQPWYIATDYMIVSGDASLASLRFAEILASDFESPEGYAIVHLSSPAGIVSSASLGTVIFDAEDVALVKLDRAVPDGIPLDGVILIQPFRPMRLDREPVVQQRDHGYDDYVADIVAAVSESGFQGYITQLQSYLTRYSSTDNYDTAAIWVRDTINGFGIPAQLETFSVGGSYNCVNVVAEKQGLTYPDQIYIICAHLDDTSPQQYSNAPGGDDNASGSATVVEAARIMSNYNFRYTVRFICFGGEEQGLYGSSAYASAAQGAGDDILGVVNIDMILYGPAGQNIFWVPYDTQSTGLALALDAICDTYVPALSVSTEYSPGTTYSDHSSFWNEGYAAVLGIEQEVYSNPYYHQTTDLLSNYMVYFPFGTNCAKGAIATTAYLAQPLGPTGIEDQGSATVGEGFAISSLGPNPAGSFVALTIDSPVPQPVSVQVIDLSGRVLLSSSLSHPGGSAPFELSTEGLPDGIFFVRASGDGVSDTARFVKAQ